MIKAIIFDCFGVLCTEGLLAYIANLPTPEGRVEASDLNKQVDLGNISYDGYIDRLAELGNVTSEDVRRQLEQNAPNAALFGYIREELKPRYKVGMLSNAGKNWLSEIFAPEQLELFDDIVLSYQVKMIKPDPQIFELTAKRLGASVQECVFVDDREVYTTGAIAAGMPAITFTNYSSMREELDPILSGSPTAS